jgi:glycolate oxidase FAD binding subunit
LGGALERYDVALDLSKLNAVVEHEPADLTCTVEAGMGLVDLQRALGAHGQWLPLDPGLPEGATIGGILATNTSGPARIRYGGPRDVVIGMTVALANGDLVKSGGRVVKNVAGYDMAKLHIGALGTLGVITQASFKIAPLPLEEVFVAINGGLDDLSALATNVIEARLPLLGLVLGKKAAAADWMLAVRAGGAEPAVERAEHDLMELAKGAGLIAGTISAAEWRSNTILASQDDPSRGGVTIRATVPPTALMAIAAAIAESGAAVAALPGVGTLHASWTETPSVDTVRTLRGRCEAKNGALVLESAPSDLKREAGVWGATRSDFALMQRLKQQFDPNRVLNPGRFLGGI